MHVLSAEQLQQKIIEHTYHQPGMFTSPTLEKSVIGLLLLNKNAFQQERKSLHTGLFSDEWMARIYDSMDYLDKKEIPIDLVAVAETMRNKGWLKSETDSEKLEAIRKKERISRKERDEMNRILFRESNYGTLDDLISTFNIDMIATTNVSHLKFHVSELNKLHMARQFFVDVAKIQERIAKDGVSEIGMVMNQFSKKITVSPKNSMFRVRNANDRVLDGEKEPELKKLLGNLLRHQDIAIWFGEAGIGKSILAIQAADAISKGLGIFQKNETNSYYTNGTPSPFDRYELANEYGRPLKTMYVDLELKDRAFYDRSSKDNSKYQYSNNLIMLDKDPEFISRDLRKYDQALIDGIDYCIAKHEPEVLVVDNLSAMTKGSLADELVAQKIISLLQYYNIKMGITVLALAHMPKGVDPYSKITKDNMAGSSILNRLSENMVSIRSVYDDPGMVYIKEVKTRNGSARYHSENVITAYISHQDSELLSMRFTGCEDENTLLKKNTPSSAEENDTSLSISQQMYDIRLAGHVEGGMNANSYEDISERFLHEVNWSAKKVERAIKKYAKDRIPEYMGRGPIPFSLDPDFMGGPKPSVMSGNRPMNDDDVPF